MPLPESLYAALKADIAANTTVVTVGGVEMQIKDVPNTDDTNGDVANWYNQPATPDFWVWRSSVTRSDVYHSVSPTNSVFDWATYKAQAVPEQGAWTQMFMGDQGPMSLLSFRAGVFAIFSGSAAQNAQRAHVFAVGKRKATRAEKLFATAPVNSGNITVGPNNGNTTGDAAGALTNPFVSNYEAPLTASDVTAARSS